MWVSIQNGRKKDKDNSFDKIKQFIKLTDKSSFSTSLNKSTALTYSRVQYPRDPYRQKQNQNVISSRYFAKIKPNMSQGSLLQHRSNLGPYIHPNIQDVEFGKKSTVKNNQQQSFLTNIVKKIQDSFVIDPDQQFKQKQDRRNSYFFKILLKKNKLRAQFNINIHNSICTFKQFIRSCQAALPKAIDTRIPLQDQNRKTIIFDMDQTLIHTNQVATPNFQIKVPYRSFQGRVNYGFVEVRPYCRQVLKRLSQHFDIIIFTASTQAYADPIIDHIDPDRVVQFRLYRESCSLVRNQIFVKDLRVIGRRLSNLVLVDNAPYSYLMQLDNGIPIMPYYRGKDDEQLIYLEQYLMKLKDVQDVRQINRQYFKLHEYTKFDTHDKLINKLYSEWTK